MFSVKEALEAILWVGRREGWTKVLKPTLFSVFTFRRAWVCGHSHIEPLQSPRPESEVTLRLATLDDIALFDDIVPPLRTRRFFNKIQSGERCMLALREGKIVGFVWAAFAGTPSAKDSPLDIGPAEAYIWGFYVLPQWRSRGVGRALLLSMFSWLQANGYTHHTLIVDRTNNAGVQAAHSAGFHIRARLTSLLLFGWRIAHITPIEPSFVESTHLGLATTPEGSVHVQRV